MRELRTNYEKTTEYEETTVRNYEKITVKRGPSV
jgi:hypothetical protein